jgi:hypothetical protein
MRRRATETRSLSAKELLMNRLNELPDAVKEALMTKKWKVSDHEIFAFVKAGGKTEISIFTKSLDEGIATNVHQGVMPNDMYFLATSIVLTSAESATAGSTISDAVKESFSTLNPIIRNGKFTLKCGQDTYVDKAGCGLFQLDKSHMEKGEYKLENPKFFYAKQELTFDIEELGAALPAETWIKLRIKGLRTTKN